MHAPLQVLLQSYFVTICRDDICSLFPLSLVQVFNIYSARTIPVAGDSMSIQVARGQYRSSCVPVAPCRLGHPRRGKMDGLDTLQEGVVP